MKIRAYRNVAAVVLAASALGACESSSRLGSLLPEDSLRPASRTSAAPAPLTPAPASEVDTSALPPPPGTASTESLPAPGQSMPGQALPGQPAPLPGAGGVATAPGAPLTPPPGTQPNPPANPPRIANAPAENAAPAAPSRTSVIGNWALAEAAGGRCRITLSSAPKLDLYGAGTSGCQSKELQRVNAWELNGSEVILYEPGGGVVARLRQSGAQNFTGAVAKTGAPVTISK